MPRREISAISVMQYESRTSVSGVIPLTDLSCPYCVTVSSLWLDGRV